LALVHALRTVAPACPIRSPNSSRKSFISSGLSGASIAARSRPNSVSPRWARKITYSTRCLRSSCGSRLNGGMEVPATPSEIVRSRSSRVGRPVAGVDFHLNIPRR
jgi:hypothetical protein